MIILFFDTYISAEIGSKGGSYQCTRVEEVLGNIRDNFNAYRWQKKIDVVKYTLASYAKINWDKVIIRFECEDKNEVESFSAYCKKLFPGSEIFNERSDTAKKYTDAFNEIDEVDDPWIFFSPNNDHPYLADPAELNRYLEIADKVSRTYPNNITSLLYSHYTESMNDNYITDPQWGYFGFKFKKVIYEDVDVIVSKSNRAPLDSIQIFKLSYLKNIFSSTTNMGRVIRLEDTEFCSAYNKNIVQISPKIELCRHYDSYTHIMDYVPPLFIPDGFFEYNIQIRYGYDDLKIGWVNINPLKNLIGVDVDLLYTIDDIPFFWRDRIGTMDINPNFPKNLNTKNLSYYVNLRNPWSKRSKYFNIARSIYIYIFLQGRSIIRLLIRNTLIKLGIFEEARRIKRFFFS